MDIKSIEIEKHLSKLPFPLNEMALKETDERTLSRRIRYNYKALGVAFPWHLSEMGYDFWFGVYDELEKNINHEY